MISKLVSGRIFRSGNDEEEQGRGKQQDSVIPSWNVGLRIQVKLMDEEIQPDLHPRTDVRIGLKKTEVLAEDAQAH